LIRLFTQAVDKKVQKAEELMFIIFFHHDFSERLIAPSGGKIRMLD